MLVRRVRPLKPTFDTSLVEGSVSSRKLLHGFGNSPSGTARVAGLEAFPRMNLSQDDENLYLHAELPGVDPDQLSISALPGSVSLAGRRVLGGAQSLAAPSADCAFDCTVSLPAEVDAERVDAGYCDGVLALTLPKLHPSVEAGRC